MSILYSIPVHECEECIKQICDGILFFDNDAIIVLHISDSQSIDFFKSYSDRILINKKQFATHWGWDLAKVHVSNYLYVKNNFNFDISHVIFLSSNCLMIKNPRDFIKDYDIGFSEFVESYLNPNYKDIKSDNWYKRTPPILVEDYQIGWGGPFLNDERYLKILEELNSNNKYGCMIDGCYVNNNIMDKICYFYNKYFSDEEYLKYIFHNAGIAGDGNGTHFSKISHQVSPFNKYLVVNDDNCTYKYVQEIKDTEQNFKDIIC